MMDEEKKKGKGNDGERLGTFSKVFCFEYQKGTRSIFWCLRGETTNFMRFFGFFLDFFEILETETCDWSKGPVGKIYKILKEKWLSFDNKTL